MGVIFIEHPGGLVLYACAACNTVLSNEHEHIRIQNRDREFPEHLFNKVVNVTYSELVDDGNPNERLLSGRVSCKKCNISLGFMFGYSQTNCKEYNKKHVICVYRIAVLQGFHEV